MYVSMRFEYVCMYVWLKEVYVCMYVCMMCSISQYIYIWYYLLSVLSYESLMYVCMHVWVNSRPASLDGCFQLRRASDGLKRGRTSTSSRCLPDLISLNCWSILDLTLSSYVRQGRLLCRLRAAAHDGIAGNIHYYFSTSSHSIPIAAHRHDIH